MSCRLRLALLYAMIPGALVTSARADGEITIESLLKGGWEIVGYVGTGDNRSTLILFKHKDKTYLTQCMAFFDVTRTPRTHVNCYELH